MKKTIIALLACAGLASAETATLQDAVATYDAMTLSSGSVTVADWTASNISVAVSLDVVAVSDYLKASWIGGKGSVDTIFNIDGTWSNTGEENKKGLNFNGSSGGKWGAIYAQAWSANGSSTALSLGEVTGHHFTGDTDWDNIAAMSLVMTHKQSGDVLSTCLTMLLQNGTYESYYATYNGIKWNDSKNFSANGTISDINTTLITDMAVFDSELSRESALAVSKELATPEPATATLSLLALAALASRRRRH